MIPGLRGWFNETFSAERYADFIRLFGMKSRTVTEFRLAETPVFVAQSLLQGMADDGKRLCSHLIGNREYLDSARGAIPQGFSVADETPHPHFLTADFALVQNPAGELVPRLVEIQAFPSVFAFQATLCDVYRETYGLEENLGTFLSGLDEPRYWELLKQTVVGRHDPENVVLTEVDPLHQKTLPDFNLTAEKLGIHVVDITQLKAIGNTLHYADRAGRWVPIHRIYNRAIADELIAKQIHLPFDLTRPWQVEWAGHPNWYFLISKFSVPWLSNAGETVVPPAVYLNDFLAGPGRKRLEDAGVSLPSKTNAEAAYDHLLLKPLFSFAGKGIQFEPTQAQLEAIPVEDRGNYLLQQRMTFVPTIATPAGATQGEFRILYLWPDSGTLTPALSLVRLGRGKMMGVDHNRDQQWVGASAAFFPRRG